MQVYNKVQQSDLTEQNCKFECMVYGLSHQTLGVKLFALYLKHNSLEKCIINLLPFKIFSLSEFISKKLKTMQFCSSLPLISEIVIRYYYYC